MATYSFLFAAIMLKDMVKICESQLRPTPTPTRCFNDWINSQHLSVTANTKQKGQILAQKFGAGARGALWWDGGPRDRCSRGTGIGWGWDWGGYGVGEGLMADCQQLKSVKAHTYIRYTQINRFNLFCHFVQLQYYTNGNKLLPS